MKILSFFLFFGVIFALLDPDPAAQINADPKPCFDPSTYMLDRKIFLIRRTSIRCSFSSIEASVRNRELQRDVVYLGWLIAPSYMSPNAGGELRGVSQRVQLYTWSRNILWRSNTIFNLWSESCILKVKYVMFYTWLFSCFLVFQEVKNLSGSRVDEWLDRYIPQFFTIRKVSQQGTKTLWCCCLYLIKSNPEDK